jgi:TolA-binding protein
MNQKLKLALYVVLGGALLVLGLLFSKTLALKEETTTSGTNTVATTTNLTANATNSVAAAEDFTQRKSSKRMGRLMAYGVAGFFVFVGLAVLIAHDVSRYVANRVDDFIFNDDLKGVKDPEYEEAEKVWAKGEYLEAIRMLRDYLNRHPREQYVSLRIAEIYEDNLGNHLAAALEYEEILQKRLPHERWGWAAIHLANIYSGKLNRGEEAEKLLHRIVNEYGETAAAKKARERLGIPQPVEDVPVAAPEPESPTPKKEEPPSNLPKGFRPK